MAESITRYKSVSEIAEMYGMSKDTVRDMCHARGARFAIKPNGGKIYIDHRRFREYLERKRREGA